MSVFSEPALATLRRLAVAFGVLGLSALVGALAVVKPQVAFLAVLFVLCIGALAAPVAYWAAAALVAAILFRGLVTLGALPSVATYIDIPLCWGALIVAVLKTSGLRTRPKDAHRILSWLGALSLAMVISWAFSNAELMRPILDLALLAEPYALIAALLIDAPRHRERRMLKATVLVVVLAQIPFAYWQVATLGTRDPVQGTLYGAGAGAHTMSAVVTVGAIWIALNKRYSLAWRCVLVALLAPIPFLADAKQVIFALPAVLVMVRWGSLKDVVLRVAGVAMAIAALILLFPAGRTSIRFINESLSGHGGKEASTKVIWDRAKADPATIVFGEGPAESVSRAAFMTTDLLLKANSPLRVFDLKPAQIALQAEASAHSASGGGSSLNSGLSSALGVFGDLGLIGLFAYGGLLLSVLGPLRRTTSPEGLAAGAGFSMFVVLGLVFDWWEQPPFSMLLAVLAGLALSRSSDEVSLTSDPV